MSAPSRRPAHARCGPVPAPAVTGANDPSAVEVGTRFRSDTSGYVTGDPLLQGRTKHRRPCRPPVDRLGSPALDGDVQRRERLGLAAGDVWRPCRDQRQHDLRGLVSHERRVLLCRQRLLCLRGRAQRPVVRAAGHGIRRQWCLPLRLDSIPERFVRESNFWVDVVFVHQSVPTRRRRQSPRVARQMAPPTLAAIARSRHLQRRSTRQRSRRSTFELRDGTNALVPATVSAIRRDAGPPR